MSEYDQQCTALNQFIRDSREYRAYIFARNALHSHEDLYQQLQELKKTYRDVEQYTQGNPFQGLQKLCGENEGLLQNSVVSEFLRAERDLKKLLRETIDRIMDGISMDA